MLVNDKVATATFSVSHTVGNTLNFNQTDNNTYLYAVLCCVVLMICCKSVKIFLVTT